MPLLPPDRPAPGNPGSPLVRVIMDSPRAAADRAAVYHRRTRVRPRERALRAVAVIGALLVHVLFLFSFVLGPAYEVVPPPPMKQQFMQVRLITKIRPPVPHGTPVKQLGPRHQGHADAALVAHRPRLPLHVPLRVVQAPASMSASAPPVAAITRPERKGVARVPAPARPVAKPPVSPAAKAKTPSKAVSRPQPAPKRASSKPQSASPKPLPLPSIRPLLQAPEPPQLSLPSPPRPTPVPPPLQPQQVRRPQLEGDQPVQPPASLAVSARPAHAMVTLTVSPVAVPFSRSPPVDLVRAAPVPAPAAAPLQAGPPALAPMPRLSMPSIRWQPDGAGRPRVSLPSVPVDAVAVSAVASPASPAADLPTPVSTPLPAIDVAATRRPTIQPPELAHLPLSMPVTQAIATTSAAPVHAASTPPKPAPPTLDGSSSRSPVATKVLRRDVSAAPDATPAGSDLAIPGLPEGTLVPLPGTPATAAPSEQVEAAGQSAEASTVARGTPIDGQPANTPVPGSYVQLKPHGDTAIMRHSAPDIGYRPTRFSKDWTPYGESSVDTALRHAIEKTTIGHTFHLPRGVRIRCALTPLRLVSLFSCTNPDPPPKPVAEKVYERLHLPSADPLLPVAAVSAAAAPVAASPLQLDNSAECATARVTGGPMPPGCAKPATYQPIDRPASASSAWVPASDQFH